MSGATTGGAILAIEDEVRNIALLRAILEPAGYDLTIAANLAEARAWLRERAPSLVLLDRHLPDGDGLDLARELKAAPPTAEVPILLVSASVLPVDRVAAEAAGCDGFLDKPLRVGVVLETVERFVPR
jgi:CheY-like chemotaxis protein